MDELVSLMIIAIEQTCKKARVDPILFFRVLHRTLHEMLKERDEKK